MLPGLVLAALAGVPLLFGALGGVLVAAAGIALVARDQRLSSDVGVAVCVSALLGLGGHAGARRPSRRRGCRSCCSATCSASAGGDLAVAARSPAASRWRSPPATARSRSSASTAARRRRSARARRAGSSRCSSILARDDGRRRARARQPAASSRSCSRPPRRRSASRAGSPPCSRCRSRSPRCRAPRGLAALVSTSRSRRAPRSRSARSRSPGSRCCVAGWPLDPLTCRPRVRDDRAAMGAEATSYEAVAHELLADPAVVTGKLFGHPCLKIGGKVFACEHEGELLIKLPTERLEELKARRRARLHADGAQDGRLGQGAPSPTPTRSPRGPTWPRRPRRSWRRRAERCRAATASAAALAGRPLDAAASSGWSAPPPCSRSASSSRRWSSPPATTRSSRPRRRPRRRPTPEAAGKERDAKPKLSRAPARASAAARVDEVRRAGLHARRRSPTTRPTTCCAS